MSNLVPPKPRQPIQVDAAEFIALPSGPAPLNRTPHNCYELGGDTSQTE